jgi:hypothetical protein
VDTSTVSSFEEVTAINIHEAQQRQAIYANQHCQPVNIQIGDLVPRFLQRFGTLNSQHKQIE